MPELPEVETTRRGIAPRLTGARIARVIVRDRRLRWPVPVELADRLTGAMITAVDRRAKYLLIRTGGKGPTGTAIVHLGMSGHLRFVTPGAAPGPHDHVDIEIDAGPVLRFNDPRRFGCWLWTDDDPLEHRLLARLGPEPLGPEFTGDYLRAISRGRRIAIKPHLMNAAIVVGIGNIYASESLFRAGIHPLRAAGRISARRMSVLAGAIGDVLTESIRYGGTTLRDFYDGDGKPGYFRNALNVYDRANQPCVNCHRPIRQVTIGQRSTFYCPTCQT